MMNKRLLGIVVLFFLLTNLIWYQAVRVHKKISLEALDKRQRISDQFARLNQKYRILQKSEKRYAFLEFVEFASQRRDPKFQRILHSSFESAQKYNLNPYLILSLIYHESGFNPQAFSLHGACGLMQINYSVWKNSLGLDWQKIFDIDYNIEHGCRILLHYIEKARGDIAQALYFYNNGFQENGNFIYSRLVLEGKFAASQS